MIVIHSSDTDDAVSSHFLEHLKRGRMHQMKHKRNRNFKTVYQCKSVKEDDDNDVNDGKTMTSMTGRQEDNDVNDGKTMTSMTGRR